MKKKQIEINFITGNKTKFKEVSELLKPIKVNQVDIDLEEVQEVEPKKVVAHKIEEAFSRHKGPFIVEDSGLMLDCLGGKLPGPFIKWFLQYQGIVGIAKLAKASKKTRAKAYTLIALAKNQTDIKFFLGEVSGFIVPPEGKYRFGYDEIFMPSGQKRTLSEMKHLGDYTKSSRAVAVKKLKKYI